MKQLLPLACAVLCLVAECAGQTSASSQKTPPKKSVPAAGSANNAAGASGTMSTTGVSSRIPSTQASPQAPPQPAPDGPKVVGPPPAGAQNPATPPDASEALKTPCGADPPDETPVGSKKPYVIGPLDVIAVSVWGNKELSGTYDIGADGMLSMHLIGQVKADGETQSSLARVIRAKLGASVFECPPEVNIQILRINSKKYYVYGEVGKPGEFPLVEDMTLLDVFANTGGFRDFANQKKIYLMRGDKKYPFNYNEVKKGKHMDQNIKIENGDRIFVP